MKLRQCYKYFFKILLLKLHAPQNLEFQCSRFFFLLLFFQKSILEWYERMHGLCRSNSKVSTDIFISVRTKLLMSFLLTTLCSCQSWRVNEPVTNQIKNQYLSLENTPAQLSHFDKWWCSFYKEKTKLFLPKRKKLYFLQLLVKNLIGFVSKIDNSRKTLHNKMLENPLLGITKQMIFFFQHCHWN